MSNTVGIFGAYKPMNFGDVLMAVAFASEAMRNGYIPLVYGIDTHLASKYGLRAESDLNVFVSQADMIAICGGAFLCLKKHGTGDAFDVASELSQLLGLLEGDQKKKLAFFTIGGDGSSPQMLHAAVARMLTRAVKGYSTVRLKSDLSHPSLAASGVTFYPDILLAAPSLFNIKKNPGRRYIVITLPRSRQALIYLIVAIIFGAATRTTVCFLVTHGLPQYYQEFRPNRRILQFFPWIHELISTDAVETARRSADWSIVISPKLHVGLVGFASGARFFSDRDNAKVLSFFSEMEMTQNLFKGRRGMFFCFLTSFFRRISNKTQDQELQDRALGHIKSFRSFLNEANSNASGSH